MSSNRVELNRYSCNDSDYRVIILNSQVIQTNKPKVEYKMKTNKLTYKMSHEASSDQSTKEFR